MFMVLEFFEFVIKVQEVINFFGGSVFFKFNWSVLRDVYWIVMNSFLKCKIFSDIFLFFKSFDFIICDFIQLFIYCIDDFLDLCIEYEFVF